MEIYSKLHITMKYSTILYKKKLNRNVIWNFKYCIIYSGEITQYKIPAIPEIS